MVSRAPISAMLRSARPFLRKRFCVAVNQYPTTDMQLTNKNKNRTPGGEQVYYSPYCTAENYPYNTAQMLVDAANRKPDHLSSLAAFKRYGHSSQNLFISCHRVTELNRTFISWALQLTRDNMRTLYEQSEWGWSEKAKLEELTNKKAWYLIVKTAEGRDVAFVHFRFDLDYGIEVLYCYEIQLDQAVRRIGLGQYLMLILELIAKQNRMKKVMLTVFKHNEIGRNFFSKRLRYEVDETSPQCRRTSYEILSKKIILPSESNSPKNSSRQAPSTCLRIRMPYSLEHSSSTHSSTESSAESLIPPIQPKDSKPESPRGGKAKIIKAKITRATPTPDQQQQPPPPPPPPQQQQQQQQLRHLVQTSDYLTVSEPNLELKKTLNTDLLISKLNGVIANNPESSDSEDTIPLKKTHSSGMICESEIPLGEPNIASIKWGAESVESDLLEPNLCRIVSKEEKSEDRIIPPVAKSSHVALDAELKDRSLDDISTTDMDDSTPLSPK